MSCTFLILDALQLNTSIVVSTRALARVRGRASKQAMPKSRLSKMHKVKKHRFKGSTAGKATAAGTHLSSSTECWYSKKHLDRSAEYPP